MTVPYFTSAIEQPHKRLIGGLSPKLSRKRKRGAHDAEETSIAENEPLLDEAPHKDEDGAETAIKAITSGSSPGTGLRQQHLSVLTSLLHRCILERHYQRASRAWGMLLRMEVNGHPLDIRAQERWGIGAELLLHGGPSLAEQADPEGSGSKDVGDEQRDCSAVSLQRGLMKAKDYYERLILEFPYRKSAPDSTSSLNFYPVMFGICIHSIQLRYKLATQKVLQNQDISNDVDSDDTVGSHDGYAYLNLNRVQRDSRTGLYRTVIQDANEILERLNELLISPPYSDHPGLWKIQGMLHLWIGQLSDHGKASENHSDNSGDDFTSASGTEQSSTPIGNSVALSQSREHSEEHQGGRQNANPKAREAFSKALALGDTLDPRIRQEVGL
ncbi:MAG: hypothetical protein Q9216_005422 [Gyalolechia sp. 2 TL-2023]